MRDSTLASGQHRRAGRPAQRRGAGRVGEVGPSRRQRIHVRRVHDGVAVDGQRIEALLIGHDDQQVGGLLVLGPTAERRHGRSDGRTEEFASVEVHAGILADAGGSVRTESGQKTTY